ncbi:MULTISPECIES: hypothetical protein [unclassified Campylobacter]|uniref:hypothetical protein n=1 Tax=unclassified Campylobacter TaxID=2593542 RepID=UPI0022E9C449|nr:MULTISPECIES: hypothetical protein [unclassified Campylobacter]MDA3042663.1 hypothetical protein [Campylobacter sp. JMF_09 ED2]MDA3044523.1 hypothetical protein [Campylobacter sp. JMF_07 ED4]MDA3063354.1 hypothetical protein [Campylobacter sp. JMF_11 EL3]MDA3071500.1 hypothetical protein [Campylobacter sp. VBCF_03 NA9]MDA3074436.1 hypothetical protein [Campylobacter sp. JMF_05 ED3]
MIISFKFDYLNNNGLIAYFLDFYARKAGLKYALNLGKNLTTLYVEADEKELLEFSDKFMALIPNSAFLAKSSVEVVSGEGDLKEVCARSDEIKFLPKFSNFTPSQIHEFLQSGEFIENEFGVLSGVSVFDGESFVAVNKQNCAELTEYAYRILRHNQILQISLNGEKFSLSADLNFENSDFMVATGLKSFNKIFITDDKQKIALATYEKPILRLKTNSVFRSSFSKSPKFFDVKMCSDLFTFALFKRLEDDEIYYVGAKGAQGNKNKFLNLCVIEDRFLITKNFEFMSEAEKTLLASGDEITHFGLICKEREIFDSRVMRVFVSKNSADEIAIYEAKSKRKLLNFAMPANLDALFDEIKSDETGAKLLANFSANASLDYARANADFSEVKPSFYGYFELLSRVIFGKDAQYLLECAGEFLGEKGMKLDFELKENGDFNFAKTLRSAMSYKLAGVDDKVLSYGVIDTLARFIGDLADANEALYDSGVLSGSLFAERRFANIATLVLGKSRLDFSAYLGLQGCER